MASDCCTTYSICIPSIIRSARRPSTRPAIACSVRAPLRSCALPITCMEKRTMRKKSSETKEPSARPPAWKE